MPPAACAASMRAGLDRLIAARLQPRLAGSVSVARRRWGFALLLLGFPIFMVLLTAVTVALASLEGGPTLVAASSAVTL
mgnify:CR=1 FL=1